MTPRPLIRWKSFWLGILVLVFLGWAWVASLSRGSEVRFYSGGEYVTLRTIDGRALFAWDLDHVGENGFKTAHFGVVTNRIQLPPPVSLRERRGGWALAVAYWFLILLFLVPWVSFLVWRVRRQRKQTETNA